VTNLPGLSYLQPPRPLLCQIQTQTNPSSGRYKNLGLVEQEKIRRRNPMFNVCVLSGPVLTEPKLTFFEGHPDTIFYLGISIGPYKAGVIKVACGHHLAPVAKDYIHRGDRLAVVGVCEDGLQFSRNEVIPGFLIMCRVEKDRGGLTVIGGSGGDQPGGGQDS
jgi:hypothetical protein